MSLTVLNWPLILTLIVISVLPLVRPWSTDSRSEQPSGGGSKALRESIDKPARRAKPEAEGGNTARPSLLSRVWPWGWKVAFRGTARALISPAIICLLFAGIGGAIYVAYPPAASGPGYGSFALSSADPEDETFAQLSDYARSVDAKAAPAPADKLLPDVSTMIDRLAARLEITPGDIRGWQMLGWSYVQTGRYDKAAAAYAKAATLDPSSAELKLALGEARPRPRPPRAARRRRPHLCRPGTLETAEHDLPPPRTRRWPSARWWIGWQIAWRVPRTTSTAGLA